MNDLQEHSMLSELLVFDRPCMYDFLLVACSNKNSNDSI